MKRFFVSILIISLAFYFICCGKTNPPSSNSQPISTKESQSQLEDSQESLEESYEPRPEESEFESDSLLESEESESISEDNSEVEISYTVTFDTDGGNEIESVIVNEGGRISKPSNPEKSSREGEFEFVRWLYEGREWNFDVDVVTEDITLVAEWKIVVAYPPAVLPED